MKKFYIIKDYYGKLWYTGDERKLWSALITQAWKLESLKDAEMIVQNILNEDNIFTIETYYTIEKQSTDKHENI